MPEDYCECGQPLNSERNKRLDKCRICENFEAKKKIEDSTGFVERLPEMRYEDGLTYITDHQPEFDD